VVHAQFAGDPTDWNARVAAALRETFNRQGFRGMVEVSLTYTANRGYEIVHAHIHDPGVAEVSPGDTLPPSELRDYSTEVRAELERIGAPLA
jgi:hypothetical protein